MRVVPSRSTNMQGIVLPGATLLKNRECGFQIAAIRLHKQLTVDKGQFSSLDTGHRAN
jgi:hypothetical protein